MNDEDEVTTLLFVHILLALKEDLRWNQHEIC